MGCTEYGKLTKGLAHPISDASAWVYDAPPALHAGVFLFLCYSRSIQWAAHGMVRLISQFGRFYPDLSERRSCEENGLCTESIRTGKFTTGIGTLLDRRIACLQWSKCLHGNDYPCCLTCLCAYSLNGYKSFHILALLTFFLYVFYM